MKKSCTEIPNLLSFDGKFFNQTCKYVIGADKVGRGPLAGPVVACAVCIDHVFFQTYCLNPDMTIFQDSKCLSEKQRKKAFDDLQMLSMTTSLKFAFGEASVSEIETENILGATTLAFTRALNALQNVMEVQLLSSIQSQKLSLSQVIVDGYVLKRLPYRHMGIVKGDRSSFCIAAASIAAKVMRDRYMVSLAEQYPLYSFEKNKGYGTAEHLVALRQYGPCEVHRPSFLKKILLRDESEQELLPLMY